MTANRYFLIAATLCGLTTLLHVFGGGPEFPGVVIATSSLDAKQLAMYQIMWHTITALLVCGTFVYAGAMRRGDFGPALILINVIYTAITALFIVFGLLWLGDIWVLPQWTIFIVIIVTSSLGLRRLSA